MTTLNLTAQGIDRNEILPHVLNLWLSMQDRKPIWDKISPEKRSVWVNKSVDNDKDPIMALAFDIYKKLNNQFFGPEFGEFEGVNR